MINSKSYGLQNETRQYLRRLYSYGRELNSSDVSDIDNFIKGLKQFNLWQNVVFWPLRSQHNIGSGSIVLSLGGAGICNGTIVNNMTWSTSGISKAAGVNGYIQVNNFPLVEGDMSAFSDTLVSAYVTSQAFLPIAASSSSVGTLKGRIALFHFGSSTTAASVATGVHELTNDKRTLTIVSSTGINNRNWFSGSTRYILTTQNGLFNSTFVEGSPTSAGTGELPYITNTRATFLLASQSTSFAYIGGMVGLANTYLTSTQHAIVRDLYKSTIGKGLGLP